MSTFLRKLTVWVATGFGIGSLIPIGQGTVAALPPLLLVAFFLRLSFGVQMLVVGAAVLAGVLVAHQAEKLLGVKDDHRIVIDEVVSVFITFLGISSDSLSLPLLAGGFFLNRVLDIWKPTPVRYLQNLPGGWGIMLDDVGSAMLGNLILRLGLFLFS